MMKLNFTKTWNQIEIYADKSKKDIDILENENLHVIIYGYPYFCNQDKWLFAEEVQMYYQKGNENFINEIDGIYTIIIVDKNLKQCKIITDRYGIYTLYYFKKDGEICISEKLDEIISNWTEIVFDSGSIIEHLNFGYKLGDKTHIKGIKQFEGSSVIIIDNELNVIVQKYWDILDITDEERISKEQFLNIFNEHIRKAMVLCEKVSLPLTGGRDSRIILSACLPYKQKLHCYTHGPDYHTDVKQAKTISQHFQLPHQQYHLGNEFGKRILERAKGNSGFLYGHGSFFDYMHVKNSFEQESGNQELLITGILGNQLYRHHPIGYSVSQNSDLSSVAELIIHKLPSAFNFRTNLFSFYDKLFTDFKEGELSNYLSESVKNVLLSSTTAKKPLDYSRYFIYKSYCGNLASNTMRFTGNYFKIIGAFFHKDLLKQLKFLSLKEMVGAEMHKYIIKMNSDYLAELKFYNSGRVVKYLKLICNNISSRIFNKTFFKHPDFANYHTWLKKFHKDFVKSLFTHENMVSAPLFDKQKFQGIIDIYLQGKVNITSKKKMLLGFSIERLIINLISVELWLKDITKDKKYRFEK